MDFIAKIFRRGNPPSGEVAKERLQLVLVHDRIRIPPSEMAAMKEELLAVVERYFDVDRDGIEITFTQSHRASRMIAEVPVSGNSRRRQER